MQINYFMYILKNILQLKYTNSRSKITSTLPILIRLKFIFTHFSDEEGNLAKFSGKVGKKKLLKMEDKAEKKKQREAELLDREARKKRLEKEEQEGNLQDAKGQAHDMFSRIFRIRVTKFFYQRLG